MLNRSYQRHGDEYGIKNLQDMIMFSCHAVIDYVAKT